MWEKGSQTKPDELKNWGQASHRRNMAQQQWLQPVKQIRHGIEAKGTVTSGTEMRVKSLGGGHGQAFQPWETVARWLEVDS